LQIKEVLFKQIRITDSDGVRSVPRIVAALEVCMNKALKGDIRALDKILKIAEKLESLHWSPQIPAITHIIETIIDPKDPAQDAQTNST